MKGEQKQQQQQLQPDKENPLNLVTKLVFHERQGYDFVRSCEKKLMLRLFKGIVVQKLGDQTFLLDINEVFPEITFKWYVISEWWISFDKIFILEHQYQSSYSFAPNRLSVEHKHWWAKWPSHGKYIIHDKFGKISSIMTMSFRLSSGSVRLLGRKNWMT